MDKSEEYIRNYFRKLTAENLDYKSRIGPVISFNGCNKFGGPSFLENVRGLTAHGTGDRAKVALKHIKSILYNKVRPTFNLNINIIAHSRGCISALKLMEYIANEKKAFHDKRSLAERVNVCLDLKDPVPGNFDFSEEIGTAVAKRVKDMSNYDFIKTAHLTYAHRNSKYERFHLQGRINKPGYEPIMPLFSDKTKVVVEPIVGIHGSVIKPESKYPGGYELVNANSRKLILDHVEIHDIEEIDDIEKKQLAAYKTMLEQWELRKTKTIDRVFHFGGKISTTGYKSPPSLNNNHLELQTKFNKKIKNELIALEVYPPHYKPGYYPYYDALTQLSKGKYWAKIIDDKVYSTKYKKVVLSNIFADTSYKLFGKKDDILDIYSLRNILSAMVKIYVSDREFKNEVTDKKIEKFIKIILSGSKMIKISHNDFLKVSGR
ncbi:hypothetical protein [Vibrio marisflavi]|nr:hypothetical protein [Vibrio marisflavi]